jgi:hypothetical protein
MPESAPGRLDAISKMVQVLSVVIGVVISVVSFNYTRQKDAEARLAESKTREFELQKYYDQRRDETDKQAIEAAKPFLELRQKRYMEAIAVAAVLASPELHTGDDVEKARKRFSELYWAELSMVEDKIVEAAMVKLGDSLASSDPSQVKMASYELAHAVRDSLASSWGISEKHQGQTNR